jgi:hypothetical protein
MGIHSNAFRVYAVLTAEITYYTCVGMPLAWWIASRLKGGKALGLLIGAPLYGLVASLWISTICFRFGAITCLPAFGFPLFLWLLAFSIARRRVLAKRNLLQMLLPAVIIVCTIAILTMFISRDIAAVGSENYFPRTNDDTFSYLGHIDQLRTVGREPPKLIYPAGYSPWYGGTMNLRAGVASLVAVTANIFCLDTHEAFFLTLRLAFILASIGVVALMLVLGVDNISAIVISLLIFSGGNFMSHQMLQQFLSSSVGVICELTVLILAAAGASSHSKPIIGVAGLACGIYSLASPEAFSVVLLGVSLGMLLDFQLSSVRQLRPNGGEYGVLAAFGLFFGGAIIGNSALWPGIISDTITQLSGAVQQQHPGDWIARFGYILQASGVIPFFKGQPFGSETFDRQLCSAGVMMATFAGVLFFTIKPGRIENAASRRVVLISSLLFLGFFQFFYFVGHGYDMLKMWDYHMFFPAVIIGLWAERVGYWTKSRLMRIIATCAGALLVGVFLHAAIKSKIGVLREYEEHVRAGPTLGDYVLASTHRNECIMPDLEGIPLNLFLYMNRWGTTPIAFDGSIRFDAAIKTGFPDKVFRMEHPSTPDAIFLDINRPKSDGLRQAAEIIVLKHYLRIVPGNGWLPVYGDDPRTSFRWMGQKGDFNLWMSAAEPRLLVLHVTVRKGPDFPSNGTIDVFLDGKTLATVGADELPCTKDIVFKPSTSGTAILPGSLVVRGNSVGVRQLSVSELYVDEPSQSERAGQ